MMVANERTRMTISRASQEIFWAASPGSTSVEVESIAVDK
jgi:hypothetical protein